MSEGRKRCRYDSDSDSDDNGHATLDGEVDVDDFLLEAFGMDTAARQVDIGVDADAEASASVATETTTLAAAVSSNEQRLGQGQSLVTTARAKKLIPAPSQHIRQHPRGDVLPPPLPMLDHYLAQRKACREVCEKAQGTITDGGLLVSDSRTFAFPPAAQYKAIDMLKYFRSYPSLDAVNDDDKEEEEGNSIAKLTAWKNRFGIHAGWRWDGIVRGNGAERRYHLNS